MRFEAFDLPESKASSQKSGGKSQQMNSDMVKISRQFRESTDVRLDYEADNDGKKISVKVINKSSGKVIREIPLKQEIKMFMLTGIYV